MEENTKYFSVYKGLQMPLVFRGFKGKYIYWGLSLMIFSFVLSAIIAVLYSIIVAIPVVLIVLGGGLYYTSQKQKKGQHTKSVLKGVFIQETTTINRIF